MRFEQIIFVGLCIAAAGCGQSAFQKPSEAATQQWNDARAGVLGSLALDQYKNGSFDKCQTTLDEALRLAPANANLHILAAKLNIEQGQLEAAERQLEQAGKLDPKNGEVDYLTGVVLQRWQQPQKAYDAYATAVAKNPQELSYLMAESEMLVCLNRPADALELLKAKVIYFEHSAAIRDAVGELLVEQSRYNEAADLLREASILATDDQTIRDHLAFALYQAGQYSAAGEVFERLLKDNAFNKRADIYAALGECQSQTGRLRDSRESLQNAVQLDSTSTGYWLALGRVTTQLGDLPRAELAVRKALSLEPKSSEAHCLLGYVRLRENRLVDALAAFKMSSQIDAKDPVSLCMQGYVLQKLGKPDEAMVLFAKALKLNPNDELANRLMATADIRE